MSFLSPLKLLVFLAFAFAWMDVASAQNLRFGADFGVGNGTLSNQGELFNQGPGTFSAYAEYAVHSRLLVGVHHLRTMMLDEGQLSTAIGFTGLTARYYPFSPMPHTFNRMPMGRATISTQDLTPFVRLSTGAEQASIRSTTFAQRGKGTSVGLYGGLDFGVEYPFSGNIGFSGQAGYYQTLISDGNVSLYNVTLGIYSFF
jgi:hypothetical protein